ncbi:hypothetical protein CC1G_04961 [Coprinopsis cinerea okayama7|uniref:Uncharacterized protein n=1 Tax=Coprinopsis cinerea (strain Okayama-7 / 130 / ATCC MYA-4618 / FGSC 9003) TaxID=240176 RepID=A8NSB0_COPC7|nr:hypothetical protein CC1G_04961 [Coprinopsis cinerea okayama7\|eukprot:XP_001835968.1 hypothetical protein CC1G_04961 [Coprinopsis cinerea okayama7\
MDPPSSAPSTGPPSRGRGGGSRPRSNRGGLGKYLRARGRGHRGGGRPAHFTQRLLLEGEGPDEEEDEEEKAERLAKYSRRQLGTNVDRYKEEEPELDSDGEPIVEPEVDLSTFLEKQRISSPSPTSLAPLEKGKDAVNEDEVDASLAHISSKPTNRVTADRKGKVQQIEWDAELDEMTREKEAAEAQWDLKARFKAKSEKLKAKPVFKSAREKQAAKVEQAPELPTAEATKPKDEKAEMEAFLDDLLG